MQMISFPDLLYTFDNGVADRYPGYFLEQGNDGNWNIGENKDRESKQIADLFVPFTVNASPFGDGRYKTEEEQRTVDTYDISKNRFHCHIGPERMTEQDTNDSECTVQNDCQQGQKRGRSQCHEHIVALETVLLQDAV